MRTVPRPLSVAAAIFLASLLLWTGRAWHERQQQAQQSFARGGALFHGQLPLAARLQGHAQALPPTAVRCSNCHEAVDRTPAGSAAPSAETSASGIASAPRPYAGVIQGEALTMMRARRGGPPSTYDNTRFCELLRTGIDPAQIVISSTMPRYTAAPSDCADLWAYLQHAP